MDALVLLIVCIYVVIPAMFLVFSGLMVAVALFAEYLDKHAPPPKGDE